MADIKPGFYWVRSAGSDWEVARAPSYSGWAKQDPIRFTCSVCGALPGALCTVEQHGKRVPVSAMPHIQRIVDAMIVDEVSKAGGR